jgi:hypothetical protein
MCMSIYKSGHEGFAAYIDDSGAAMSEVSSSHLSYPIALYQDTHFTFCLGSRPENHGGINEENTFHGPPRLGLAPFSAHHGKPQDAVALRID